MTITKVYGIRVGFSPQNTNDPIPLPSGHPVKSHEVFGPYRLPDIFSHLNKCFDYFPPQSVDDLHIIYGIINLSFVHVFRFFLKAAVQKAPRIE